MRVNLTSLCLNSRVQNEPFTVRSNAFFFHGGSEGLYASNEGMSFIRCAEAWPNLSSTEYLPIPSQYLCCFLLLGLAMSDPLSELWRIALIIPAFWTLLAFSLLVVICVLWAPSSNPTRYAYSAGDDFDEELKQKLQISLFGGCYIAGHSIM